MECLKFNIDIFAQTPADMPKINLEVIFHNLNVNPNVSPTKQKKKNIASEKQQTLEEEVNKLLKIGFI